MKNKRILSIIALATIFLVSAFFIFLVSVVGSTPLAFGAGSQSLYPSGSRPVDIDSKADLEIPMTSENNQAPGTVTYIGADKTEAVAIEVIRYNQANFEEITVATPAAARALVGGDGVTWINIEGVHDEQLLETIGSEFGLSSLVLEDIANTTKRPEYEEYDDYLFMILKMAYLEAEQNVVNIEQLSLVLGENYVITFQENSDEVFAAIKDRIRRGQGRVREMGSDYLACLIFDVLVDNYFPSLERIGEQIENLEEKILADPDQQLLTEIYLLKQELVVIRQAIWPIRDVANLLQKTDHRFISPAVRPFFAEIYQNTDQIVEAIEIFRQLEAEMLNLYDSIFNNRTNQVMKILTIFSAIFIPLTFLTGVYGMNFRRLPGLQSRRGHIVIFFIMLALAIVMLIFFNSLNWF
jgi:magnesium transporter